MPHPIPAELTCDVCSAEPGGLWFYPTGEWDVEMLGRRIHFEEGCFGLCDACAALAEANDPDGMVLAAEAGNGTRGPGFRAILLDTYQKFLKARLGPPGFDTDRSGWEEAHRAHP